MWGVLPIIQVIEVPLPSLAFFLRRRLPCPSFALPLTVATSTFDFPCRPPSRASTLPLCPAQCCDLDVRPSLPTSFASQRAFHLPCSLLRPRCSTFLADVLREPARSPSAPLTAATSTSAPLTAADAALPALGRPWCSNSLPAATPSRQPSPALGSIRQPSPALSSLHEPSLDPLPTSANPLPRTSADPLPPTLAVFGKPPLNFGSLRQTPSQLWQTPPTNFGRQTPPTSAELLQARV